MIDIAPDGRTMAAADGCTHPTSAIRHLEFSNGTTHYARQCLTCGAHSNWIKVSTLSAKQITDASPFDQGIRDRFNEQRRSDQSARLAAQRNEERAAWDAWYAEYLQTPEWDERRSKVLRRAGGTCEGCRRNPQDGYRPVNVHHLTYDHAGREFLWELVAVCKDCHDRCHGRGRYAEQDSAA